MTDATYEITNSQLVLKFTPIEGELYIPTSYVFKSVTIGDSTIQFPKQTKCEWNLEWNDNVGYRMDTVCGRYGYYIGLYGIKLNSTIDSLIFEIEKDRTYRNDNKFEILFKDSVTSKIYEYLPTQIESLTKCASKY